MSDQHITTIITDKSSKAKVAAFLVSIVNDAVLDGIAASLANHLPRVDNSALRQLIKDHAEEKLQQFIAPVKPSDAYAHHAIMNIRATCSFPHFPCAAKHSNSNAIVSNDNNDDNASQPQQQSNSHNDNNHSSQQRRAAAVQSWAAVAAQAM